MRYLVTGGAGFLGSHLCDALIKRGNEVVCADSCVIGGLRNIKHLVGKPGFVFVESDVIKHYDFGPVDGVFHLASPTAPAETYKHEDLTRLVNSVGTFELLKMAEKYRARFLFASSVKVRDEINFGAAYIQGKIVGEKLCDNGWAKIARMGNVYGPRMAPDDSRVIPTFLRNVRDGKPLSVWGDGSQVDSFCYVDDVIAGLIDYMECNYCGTMELGDPRGMTIMGLARTVPVALGVDVTIVCEQPGGANCAVYVCHDQPYSNNRTAQALKGKCRKVPDIAAAVAQLGWFPKIDLITGLRLTYNYYCEVER